MTLELNKTYRIKLTDGSWTDARYIGERRSTWNPRTHYLFENLRTGRTIELKSMQKIRMVNIA